MIRFYPYLLTLSLALCLSSYAASPSERIALVGRFFANYATLNLSDMSAFTNAQSPLFREDAVTYNRNFDPEVMTLAP